VCEMLEGSISYMCAGECVGGDAIRKGFMYVCVCV